MNKVLWDHAEGVAVTFFEGGRKGVKYKKGVGYHNKNKQCVINRITTINLQDLHLAVIIHVFTFLVSSTY